MKRDTAVIDTELHQTAGLRYKLTGHIVNLALEGVTTLVAEHLPDAVKLEVSETDQDMSGALWPSGWIDVAGERHDIDDDALNDELSEALGWLDDSNIDMWRDFTADGVSKHTGASPLDVAKLTEHFADGPGDRPDLLVLVHGLANCIKDGEPDGDAEFVMENDDAFETLHGFISDARTILGRPETVEMHKNGDDRP